MERPKLLKGEEPFVMWRESVNRGGAGAVERVQAREKERRETEMKVEIQTKRGYILST